MAFLTSSLINSKAFSGPYCEYTEQSSVVIVNPGGTGMPILFISARPAPLPPSRFFMEESPSA